MTAEPKLFKVGEKVFWSKPQNHPARDILPENNETLPEHYTVESVRLVPDTCKWCGSDMVREDGSRHSIVELNGNIPVSRRNGASHTQQLTVRCPSGEMLEFSPDHPIIFGGQHFKHV